MVNCITSTFNRIVTFENNKIDLAIRITMVVLASIAALVSLGLGAYTVAFVVPICTLLLTFGLPLISRAINNCRKGYHDRFHPGLENAINELNNNNPSAFFALTQTYKDMDQWDQPVKTDLNPIEYVLSLLGSDPNKVVFLHFFDLKPSLAKINNLKIFELILYFIKNDRKDLANWAKEQVADDMLSALYSRLVREATKGDSQQHKDCLKNYVLETAKDQKNSQILLINLIEVLSDESESVNNFRDQLWMQVRYDESFNQKYYEYFNNLLILPKNSQMSQFLKYINHKNFVEFVKTKDYPKERFVFFEDSIQKALKERFK